MSQLRKVSRKRVKIKIAISAPTGFGKTYSALRLAYGLVGDWEKIAVIDSENESADLYEHLGDYNVISMKPPFTVDKFESAVKDCIIGGIECIIVDSTYHYWHGKGGLLEFNSSMTGNSFTNWAKTNPVYNRWLDTILQTNAHFICTSRKKQAYEIVKNGDKTTVEKKGMEDQVRDGFDYEMTVSLNIISKDHLCEASKDRTQLFDSVYPFLITEETGKLISEWCLSGAAAPAAPLPALSLAACKTVADLQEWRLKDGAKMTPEIKALFMKRYNMLNDNELIEHGNKQMEETI